MNSAIIVDDENLIKQSLRRLLEDSQLFTVVGEAVNGLEALKLVKELSPDLIITDIRMPVMNGLHFIEQVVKLYGKAEIVIISGYDEFEYARQAISLGVSEYILKPVKPVKFLETIQRVHKKCVAVDFKIQRQLELIKTCRSFASVLIDSIWTFNEAAIESIINDIKDYGSLSHHEYVSNKELFMSLVGLLDEEWSTRTNGQISGDKFISLGFTDYLDKNIYILYEGIRRLMDSLKLKHNWSMGKIVKCSMEYLKANYNDQALSLQKAADNAGISAAYLSKGFLEETGINFVRYLTNIRIEEAKKLLGTYSIKVYEVASKVGFGEYPHFARVYKKYTGLSPSEYRQRIINTSANVE